MNKLMTTFGVLALVAVLALPVIVSAHDWGRGRHMMGFWGDDSAYGRGSGNLTAEQTEKLRDLDRTYYGEMAEHRNLIRDKSADLDAVLNSPNPDLEKAKTIQKEISDLRANLDEKALKYELEARKITPEFRSGNSESGWYGHHMGRYDRGMGYGPGSCWR